MKGMEMTMMMVQGNLQDFFFKERYPDYVLRVRSIKARPARILEAIMRKSLKTFFAFAAEPRDDCDFGESGSKTVLNSTSPVAKYCYDCNRVVWTKIRHYPTMKTKVMALGLSPCLLCWVPNFCHWKAEIDHHCSFCDGYLGTFDPAYDEKDAHDGIANAFSPKVHVEKKVPQKKYREAGRRCGEFAETIAGREDIIKVFANVLQ